MCSLRGLNGLFLHWVSPTFSPIKMKITNLEFGCERRDLIAFSLQRLVFEA